MRWSGDCRRWLTCGVLRLWKGKGGRHETRQTIPAFALERYTRDETKWEPRSNWPAEAANGDWHVVIYDKDASLEITSNRYIEQSVAGIRPAAR
jgi:hypothetical protein